MDSEIIAGILTISDKGAQGIRTDESGPVAAKLLQGEGFSIQEQDVVPDRQHDIINILKHWVDDLCLDLIITSGGTGLSPTDVTPQAMEAIIDYQVPGMAEAMRAESLKKTPHAMISRAMVGVRKGTLIINLPGSPGGVRDNLTTVLPALKHALSKLAGDTRDCAA
jgi:molybdenum cofactor synthesis domain-containing protein